MIPPLGLFNVSRYKRRDTEKRVNKIVQMSALCHSALVFSRSGYFKYSINNQKQVNEMCNSPC